jgi:predicted lysophospholipase L1 biosynthesis ABC-type transport system permease subunit
MMIAPVKGPDAVADRARFQHDLVERFPNVSVIDLREMLQTVRDVMNKVTLAISVVGGLVLLSGVLILIGAVAMTQVSACLRGRRLQDARREHQDHRADAAARVQRARPPSRG